LIYFDRNKCPTLSIESSWAFSVSNAKIEIMRNLAIFLTFIGLLAIAYFAFPQIQNLVYFSTCDNPIHYKIGAIDPKFNLTQTELKEDLSQAGNIWGDAEGKPLFQFDPQAPLTVSMVYDERQYLQSKLDQEGNSLDKLSGQVNDLKGNLSSEQKTLDQEVAQFEAQVADFKTKLANYNAEVQHWNSQGGAPPEEYQKLQQEKQDLQNQQQSLNDQEAKLEQETKSYNGDVDKLNQTISSYNEQVGTIKSTASNLTQTIQQHPEEGVFDSGTDTIDIYYNISHAELVHTLAHEFGHAIGMDHNQDKNSIMYPFTTSNIKPSSEDLASLNAVCQKQTVFNQFITKLKNIKFTQEGASN
jgi:hypothetical protein